MRFKNMIYTRLFRKNERSFYSTLLLSFLVISLISSILLTVSLVINFSHTMTSLSGKHSQQLLSQTNYAIDKLETDASRLKSSLMNNDQISAFLSLTRTDNTVPVLASQEIKKQLMVLPYVQSIYLYNANLDLLYSSVSGYQLSPSSHQDPDITSRLNQPEFFSSYKGQPIPLNTDSSTDEIDTLRYYVFGDSVQDTKSFIVLNINISSLTESISTMTNLTFKSDSNFLLLDENYNYLTGLLNTEITDQDAWITSALQKISSKSNTGSSFLRIDGQKYLWTETNTNAYGWHLINFTPVSSIYYDLLILALLSLLIMAFVLLFTWFICRRFARQLYKPLETLADSVQNHNWQEHNTFKTREFKTIMNSITTLHNTNQQLRSLQNQTRYSLVQSTMNDLVSHHHVNPPEQIQKDLEYLKLSYLTTQKLCMAVFKIDHYARVLTEHSPDEMWALRFSVVNILDELTSAHFQGNSCSHDDDKFLLFIACEADVDLVAFEDQLLLLFQSAQENIAQFLHITVTIAYSSLFQGLERLPMIYSDLEASLKLKIQYGHQAIIDPYKIDDVRSDMFRLSSRLFSQFTDQLLNAQFPAALETYHKLTQDLFTCDYSEILSTLIHIIHTIYERVSEKYPMLKDYLTVQTKDALGHMEDVEIREDIDYLFEHLIQDICNQIEHTRDTLSQQNSSAIVQKIKQIIEEEYSDFSLCLSSIADRVGLSPNYTGHLFKQHTQKSIAQYLLDIRMEQVAFYLQNSSLPLNKILDKVGMEKNNYFYTRFKNHFGISLGEYRQKYCSQQAE